MLGPIPNSLGAGAYNGSFIPHGLVTFSSRATVAVINVLQEVCLDAFLHSSIILDAVLHQSVAILSDLHDLIDLSSTLNPDIALNSDLHDTIAMTAQIEDC